MLLSEAFEAFIVDELIGEFRSENTILGYRKALDSILHTTEDMPVSLITYMNIILWKKYMVAKELSSSTVAHYLMRLRRVLKYLRAHGFETLDPAEIKIPKVRYETTAWLTLEELRRFMAVIDNPRDRALFGCLFSSGARISELLSLNRDSITNKEAVIVGKGKYKRTLHFDDNALALLNAYLATRKDQSEPLFLSAKKHRITDVRVNQAAKKYAKKAGINKRISSHVFRHSFGTNLELNGLDIYGVSQQMGHKDIQTTRIYMHGAEIMQQSNYNKFHTPTPL